MRNCLILMQNKKILFFSSLLFLAHLYPVLCKVLHTESIEKLIFGRNDLMSLEHKNNIYKCSTKDVLVNECINCHMISLFRNIAKLMLFFYVPQYQG